ncbi:MAG: protein kinase domain-containing protein [Burkholderiales bacterium]
MNHAVASKIGRFEIDRVLASGRQGTVYLARDTGSRQPVVVKSLTVIGASAASRKHTERVLAAAPGVRDLSHPGVVSLIDAGEADGTPYLVYEYVEGELLSDVLSAERRLPIERALDLTIQVLKALGAAHNKGVVHRDLKPENVILTADDAPRIMDFGIGPWVCAHAPQAEAFCGAPSYTAPECAAGWVCTPAADLFSVAMLLYRMLAGRAAVSGPSATEIVHQVANVPFAPPSRFNPRVDERLDDLLLKALAKKPDERFQSAAKMEDALYLYLNPRPENNGTTASSTGTLDFLLRRMRHKSDFPALSATISAINRASASEDESANTLTRHILKDFALTNKLLKMVNSVYFGSFGGTISTISKAVVIMGFDRIRDAAITLMLFEHLQNKTHAARLREDLVASYFSGVLARQLVAKTGIRNVEEAFICAIFHNLGRLLTSFYFPEEDREIQKLIQQKGVAEMQASLQVLGVAFEDLGMGVAKVWNFPQRLVQSMRHIKDDKVERPETEDAKLRVLASLSAQVCDAMRDLDEHAREDKLKELVLKYGAGLGMNANLLASSIKECAAELAKDAVTLNLKAKGSAFLASTASAGEKTAAAESAAEIQSVLDQTRFDIAAFANAETSATDPQRKAALFNGIQDITTTLMGEFKLNDVLREILETMYRSMGFTRVLLFVRDPVTNALKSRLGLGDRVDDIIAGGFSISIGLPRDVFQAAVVNGADVFIENVNAESIRKHIPDSYRKAIPASSFALFPIVIKGKPVGLLYGDCDVENAMRFSTEELSLLKTLRNQAVIAIKQSA